MSSLREELNKIVEDFEVRSGLVESLTQQAFTHLTTACKIAAARGKREVKGLPIHFSGCEGGYIVHMDEVIKQLKTLLNKEGLQCDVMAVDGGYRIRISW